MSFYRLFNSEKLCRQLKIDNFVFGLFGKIILSAEHRLKLVRKHFTKIGIRLYFWATLVHFDIRHYRFEIVLDYIDLQRNDEGLEFFHLSKYGVEYGKKANVIM